MSKHTLKKGQVVESYQGKFAKVLTEEGAGRYGLSAWVGKKEVAEAETTAVHFLNGYGLSQVLKGGQNVPGAAKAAPKAETVQAVPEKEEAEKPKKEAAKKAAKQD